MLALVIAGVVAAACGGGSSTGSGLPGDKKLVDLTSSDVDALCAYSAQVEMAPRTVDCGNGSTVTLKSKTDCVSGWMVNASCTATVSQAESCFEAIDADPCNFGGSACSVILQCVVPH